MATNMDLLKEIGSKKFQEQAIWMLNAMWPNDQGANAEEIYQFVSMFAELDIEDGKEGCALDELGMHRAFERLQKQLTMQEMRNHMRTVGVQSFKKISMINFLIFYYGYNWEEVVNAPQGGNTEGIQKAKQMLEEVTVAFEEAQKKAAEAKQATDEARQKAAEAKQAADEAAARQQEAQVAADEAAAKADAAAKAAEIAEADQAVATKAQAEAQAAEDEVTAALNAVKAQEEAKEKKRQDLQKKIETAGLVARNAAIQELAKLDGEDDLPMRRAKTTLEAAQRKAAKANKIATDAKDKADATAAAANEAKEKAIAAKEAADAALQVAAEARQRADAAKEQADAAEAAAVQAQVEAEQAVEDAERKVAEAEEYLAEQQRKAEGAGQGTIWFMQREVEEKKKYMPTRRGGIAKN